MEQVLEYIESKYTVSNTLHYQLLIIRPRIPISSEFYSLSLGGLLIIRPGYSYDGPSGPTKDTPDVMFCSLVHDVLYEMFRKGQLSIEWRDEADEELAEIGKACGASHIRMELWEWSVDKWAEGSALPENKKVVHRVPAITSREEV